MPIFQFNHTINKKYTSLNIHHYIAWFIYMNLWILIENLYLNMSQSQNQPERYLNRTPSLMKRYIKIFKNILPYNLLYTVLLNSISKLAAQKWQICTCTVSLPLLHNWSNCITGRSCPGTWCIIWSYQRKCCPTWSCPACIIWFDKKGYQWCRDPCWKVMYFK